jgi:Rrf2 family protein
MHVSAKADYALRACVALAAVHPQRVSAAALAESYDMPRKFLEAVLADLRRASVVRSVRGAEGGYTLAREPEQIAAGEVLRAIDGPLSHVHGRDPHELSYPEDLSRIQELWLAARAAVRLVLDEVTLAELVGGEWPPSVAQLLRSSDLWEPRTGPQKPRTQRGGVVEWAI